MARTGGQCVGVARFLAGAARSVDLDVRHEQDPDQPDNDAHVTCRGDLKPKPVTRALVQSALALGWALAPANSNDGAAANDAPGATNDS